jgi:MFS family permease
MLTPLARLRMLRLAMHGDSSRQPTLADLFRNRNFVKFWVGQLISYLGDRIDQMSMIAVVSAGVAKEIAADRANMITFWATLPYVFMSIVAGAIVDRFDRRRLMITLDIFRAVIVVALPFTISPAHDVRVIYALVLLIGCATAIFAPAKSAFIPEIVPDELLLRANSVTATMGTLATLIGTVIGGVLVTLLARLNTVATESVALLKVLRLPPGLAVAFLINGATYTVSAVLLWLIIVQARHRSRSAARNRQVTGEGGLSRQVLDGLVFLKRNRVPAVAAFVVSWFYFIGGAYFTLVTKLIYLRLVRVREEATLYLGYGYGMLGLGLALGGIIAGRVTARSRLAPFVGGCFALAALLVLANLLPLPPAFLYLINALVGFVGGGVVVVLETVLLKSVPDGMRGRVFAFNNLLLNALLLGSLLAGAKFLSENSDAARWLASIDTRLTVWTLVTSALAVVGAVVSAVGFPKKLSLADIHTESETAN